MNKFQYISKNLPLFKELEKIGFISTYLLSHYSLYCRYDFYRRNNSKSESIFCAAEDFKISESTVRRVINEMES